MLEHEKCFGFPCLLLHIGFSHMGHNLTIFNHLATLSNNTFFGDMRRQYDRIWIYN